MELVPENEVKNCIVSFQRVYCSINYISMHHSNWVESVSNWVEPQLIVFQQTRFCSNWCCWRKTIRKIVSLNNCDIILGNQQKMMIYSFSSASFVGTYFYTPFLQKQLRQALLVFVFQIMWEQWVISLLCISVKTKTTIRCCLVMAVNYY